jgi:hypothetical protein
MCDAADSYAFVYFPCNDQAATLDLARFAGKTLQPWWYDPRTGAADRLERCNGGGKQTFESPPYGPDWVLVLDDVTAGYAAPGLNRAETTQASGF